MLVEVANILQRGGKGFLHALQCDLVDHCVSRIDMSMTCMVLKPSGRGAMLDAKVGPKLRISAALNVSFPLCHIWCLSLPYFATLIWAFVMPAVMGVCVGRGGLWAIVTVPFGDTDRFGAYCAQAGSFRIKVSNPVGSTSVATLEAASSACTFQEK